ncbi:uncharacterized protein DUF3644 [Thermomonas haemolytica]|uniref:Uncharacterized protein DUF3644 n=2 Tax=Thermomonas haemolytica TaxID=141949 RepID=A0A4V2V1F8_9GAMM|nr:uncharacterized protein DUF3644 [Thermomonas haemolytica]
MVSAIEVYNKPDFKYREETFSILAINAWELLLKAKWLKDHNNKVRSLYVTEKRMRPNGKPYKHAKVKMTGSGNPFTHSLDYLAKKMAEKKTLADAAHKNIIALCEIRDSSVHFYNKSRVFAVRLQEVGSASVRNYARAAQSWFGTDFSQYNFYLMPLAFVKHQQPSDAILLNKEEKNVASFISSLEAANDPVTGYAVSVNIELKFLKSKAGDAIKVQVTNDPGAPKVQLTEEHLKDKYPLNYAALTKACTERYCDFVQNKKYHNLRKPLKADKRYCHVKKLDPDNPKSAKQEWYSQAVFNVLDQHYTSKGK